MRSLLAATIATVMITSRDNRDVAKNRSAHDVQYYRDNPEIGKVTIEKCKNNPGNLKDSPDCINALDASERAMNDSIERAVKQE